MKMAAVGGIPVALGTGQLRVDTSEQISQEQSVDRLRLRKTSPQTEESNTSELRALVSETQLDIYIVCALGGQILSLKDLNPVGKSLNDSLRRVWKTLDRFKRELLSW